MASALRAVGASLLAVLAAVLGGATLLVLLLAAGVIAIDGNDLKPYIARQLSASLGREVVIAGDLAIEPGWQPRVLVHEFKIADAPWADRPYMVEIPRLTVRFDVPRLLDGDIVLHDVAVESPAVTLERAASGRANWRFGGDRGGGGGAVLPTITSLRMDGGVFTYIGRPLDIRTQIESLSVQASLTGPQRALNAQASGLLNESMPLRIDLEADALVPTRNQAHPVQADVSLGRARVFADGTVTGRDGPIGRVELDLAARAPAAATLQPLVPWDLPDWPSFRVEARLVRESINVAIEDLSARLGESDIAGRIALDLGGPRPEISAVLESGTLDVVQLMGPPPEQPTPVIPATPIPFALLQAFDAELRFEARRLYLPELSLEQVGLGLAIEDGLLRVDPLQFSVGGGEVRSSVLRIDARDPPATVAADLTLEQLGLNAMLQEFDIQANAFGRVGGTIDLTGRGGSAEAILGSADGSIALIMRGGQFDALVTALAGQDITNIRDALGLAEGATVPLRCFIADFEARNGVLNARTLVLETPDVLVVGAGDIKLETQSVNLAFLPQHKEATPLAGQAPVHVTGPFANIQVAVDTSALVASLITPIELPDADDPDCDALAEAARSN